MITPDEQQIQGGQQIHLWLAFCDDINDAGVLDRYRGLMSAEERARELRFKFEADLKSFVLTRALVRCVLSRYAAVAPEAWQFGANAHGRPQIQNQAAIACGLDFNLAHSHGLIVVAVSAHRALGVDVEHTTHRRVSLEIAERYFAADEVAALAALPAAERPQRFFEYWTLKESYIKARGLGLAIPLDQFSFGFPHPHSVAIRIDPALADNGARWRFWQLRPAADYLLSICADGASVASTEITSRRIVPLLSEQALQPQMLRS
jgi:4'-phosphopantetheinyl transferase